MSQHPVPDWCSGLLPNPAAHERIAAWFIRALGLVSFIAFWSLLPQLSALAGPGGLAPADAFIEHVHRAFEGRPAIATWQALPSLALLGGFPLLRILCLLGIVASLLLMLVRLPWLCLLVCWICYLSICCLIPPFMNFQWDALLLETLVVSLFLVPVLTKGPGFTPNMAGLVLLRLLLLKLMFSSGVVKLSFGDPTWWTFAALDVHYQTQPLPLPTAWFAHHLPDWLHRVALIQMFVVELILAVLVFAGRRPRLVAAGGIALLQVLIALTGNYTFFNLLTAALCLPLLDDRLLGRHAVEGSETCPAPSARPALAARPTVCPARAPAWILGSVLALVGSLQTISAALPNGGHGSFIRKPIRALLSPVAGFRSINEYGLFRVMTTTRPELLIEGSQDGTTWRPYDFQYKPGPLDRAPPTIAPHQPRLDWQLWFEALAWESAIQRKQKPTPSLWVQRLAHGFFTEEPHILRLIRRNPFAGKPPEFIRFRVLRYRFTSPGERAESGRWWHATPLGDLAVVLRRPT